MLFRSEVLAQLGHESLPLDRPAGSFSIANQQVIEIARALLTRPRVLIMDEPTSSLTQADTARLFEVINRLRAQGVSIIYISHFLEECRSIADRYTVLKDGESVGSGRMAETDLARIVTLMTGRDVQDLYPRTARVPGETVLEVRELASAPRLKRATLQVRAGEIVGLAGLIGAGRTELLRAAFGLDERLAGEVVVLGNAEADATPRDRWAQGVGFLSEDRKEEGLMLTQSLAVDVEPHADALGEGREVADVALHRLPAPGVELGDPERLDLLLAREAEFLLDLHLDGETVTVPAALAADEVAPHGLEAGVDVLEEPGPRMVQPRAAVRRRRPLVEHPLGGPGAASEALAEHVVVAPAGEHALLERDEIEGTDGGERHGGTVHNRVRPPARRIGGRAASLPPRHRPGIAPRTLRQIGRAHV